MQPKFGGISGGGFGSGFVQLSSFFAVVFALDLADVFPGVLAFDLAGDFLKKVFLSHSWPLAFVFVIYWHCRDRNH